MPCSFLGNVATLPFAASLGGLQSRPERAPVLRSHRNHRRVVCRAAASAASTSSGTRLTDAFNATLQRNQPALIPFICAGDPSLDVTALALRALDDAGADIIELGVPYSDPLADGPVIQAAATRALANGATLDRVLALVKQVAPTLRAPLILFTYYNPILRRGLEPFISEIAAAGVGGLLIPDIPLEETTEARALCARYKLELVLLATPTTQSSRMARIAEATAGFVYLVSVTGVTGVQDKLQDRVERLVAQLKAVTNKPVAVGFGVSKPEQAAQLAAWGADGVIVGSALVRALGEAPTPEAGLASMTTLIKSLREALPARSSTPLDFLSKLFGR